METLRRFAGPGILVLVPLGLDMSGIESLPAALFMWLIALLWGVAALLTWPPIRDKLPSRLKSVLRVGRLDLQFHVLEERWHNFQREALILELRLRLHNTTDNPLRIITIMWQSINTERSPSIDVSREVERRRNELPTLSGWIGPHDMTTGWLIVSFGHPPDAGTPMYRLTLVDQVGNEYWIDRPAKPAKKAEMWTSGEEPSVSWAAGSKVATATATSRAEKEA